MLWRVGKRAQGADEAAFLVGVLVLLAFSPIVWHHYLVLLFVPLAIYCPRFAPIWPLPTRVLGGLARCVPLHRPCGAAGVPRRDRGHLRLDADAHARCRRPGGRSRGAAWHTARVAMRPTYRVRIEYCVP